MLKPKWYVYRLAILVYFGCLNTERLERYLCKTPMRAITSMFLVDDLDQMLDNQVYIDPVKLHFMA